PRVAPCSPRVPPCCPARHALLLPSASRPAAHTSHPAATYASRPAAPCVAPCCSPRVAPHCCPACRALLPCPARAPLPCPARRPALRPARRPALRPARRAALPLGPRIALPLGLRAALPCSPQPRCPALRPARRPALQPARCAVLPLGPRAALPLDPRAALPLGPHTLPCSPRAPPALRPACHPALRPALPAFDCPSCSTSNLHESTQLLAHFPSCSCVAAIWAVRWGATTRGTCESTPAGSAASRCGGSGGAQQQQRLLETLSPQQLREWAVRWGSPGGGGFRGTCNGGVEAPGGVEATSLGACDSASAGAEPEEALHTFALDSGASCCFFRDSTTVTPLTAPVLVTLADPFGGPVVARGATVLPCLAAPSGLLIGLHLPSFAKNLVATSVLQDQWVTVTQPGSELVAIFTDSRTGEHLTTFTQRPGSGLYTLTTESALVAESGQVAASVERATPHSSSFPPTTATLHTLHMDVWGPARVPGQGGERYFLLIVDDYTCYTTVFPLQSKAEARSVMICWIRAVRRQISARFQQDLLVLRLHSDRGGEFSSGLLEEFCGAEGIRQTFMLPASPQQNEIAERRIGLVMEVARTSIVHVVAPIFCGCLRSNTLLSNSTSGPMSPTQRPLPLCGGWARLVMRRRFRSRVPFRLFATPPRGSSFPALFAASYSGFSTDASGWQIHHPGSRRVLSSQDVTFDEPVCFYLLHPHRSSPVPLPPLALVFDPPPPPQVAPGAGTTRAGGASIAGAGGSATGGTGVASAGCTGARRQETLSPERLREWAVQWGSPSGGASRALPTRAGGAGTLGAAGDAGGAAAVGAAVGSPGSHRPESLSPQRLREWAIRWGSPGGGAGRAGAAGSGGAGLGGASAGVPGTGDTGAAAGTGGGADTGGTPGGSGGAGVSGASRQESLSPLQLCEWAVRWGSPGGGAGGTGSGGAVATGPKGFGGATTQPQPSTLRHLLSLPPATTEFPVAGTTPLLLFPPTDQSQPQLLPGSPLPAPAPHTEVTASLTACREPETRASTPEHREPKTRASVPAHVRRVRHPHALASADASALVAELVESAALCILDYAASLVFYSSCPPCVGGELALSCDVLEDKEFELECLAAAAPHLASTLLCPEGDTDALDIPTPRTYAEAIPGTYVDEVPPPGANIVNGMWIFRVKWPPGSPPAFKARYVARLFSQREGVDFFQTFSPTPKMTTLWVLLHDAAQRDYELHCLDFSTAFLHGSLHEAIWLRRLHSFTWSFPKGTQWSLRRPVYGLRQAPREWYDTLRTTLAALGFAPSTADPSMFLRTGTSLPTFYVLVYVDDLVFATADTEALVLVKAELQERHNCTDLGELRSYLGLQITRDRALRTITLTQSHMVHQVLQRFDFSWFLPQSSLLSTGHSLSAPPSDESVEPSGPYTELVGCLMYLMTTSGMGLVLGGPGSIVLTGHSDASWADDQTIHRYEDEIYAAAMAAQELHWLTYLLTDLGERNRSPPVLYSSVVRFVLLTWPQEANTADVFTKAIGSSDHQHFCTALGLVPTLPHLLVS
ncbi:unnamed protein product, partial [Closterium sp. NIES-53]